MTDNILSQIRASKHPSVTNAEAWNAVIASFDNFCGNKERELRGASILLARLIDKFSMDYYRDNPQKTKHEGDSLSELALQWAIDRYFAERTRRLMDDFAKFHAILVADSEVYDYNDLDNKMFHVECSPPERCSTTEKVDRIAIAITSQNRKHLYVLETNCLGRKFHIRRYWDEHNKDDDSELHDIKAMSIEKILCSLDQFSEFSDCIEGNRYIQRPSLAWFQANGLNLRDHSRQQYADARDKGYVLSWDEWDGKADAVWISLPEVIYALRELSWAYGIRGLAC